MSDLMLSLQPLAIVRTHCDSTSGALAPETFPPPFAVTTARLLYTANSQTEKADSAPASEKCSVKGCVFPASLKGHSKCRYHQLLQSEGQLFQSHQPSHLLALQAPFGVPDCEPDDSRYKDRTQLAAEREAFLMDEGPPMWNG